MSDPAGTLLSVRGDARLTVAPDYVILASTIKSSRGSKGEAVRAAASELEHLTAGLASLGGVALAASTERHRLTWSAQSATTHAERAHDEQTGRYEPTGQVIATVAVVITARAFGMLDSLSAVLASHEALNVHQVTWQVDWDNPAWPDVRASAIQAAIRKGRDYAAAVGGSLHHVEHIADVGLLGGDTAHYAATGFAMAAQDSTGGEESGTPSLDPVPQELTATIEARFTASGVALTGH